MDFTTTECSILLIVVLLRGILLQFKDPASSSDMFEWGTRFKSQPHVLEIIVNLTTYLLYSCRSISIHSILRFVVETASLVPLRNTHYVCVSDFTTEVFAV